MPDIVLHHYATSPFSEVIRLALGLKDISWKSVEIPNIAPKPDLTALTGGYERTPVLQIGADIYCDTAIIVDRLERAVPQPSLYPQPLGLAGRMIALWAGGPAFRPAVGHALGAVHEQIPQAFWDDRARRFGLSREAFLPALPHFEAQFAANIALLEQALDDGRRFIGGQQAGHADLALYMLVWFQSLRGQRPQEFGDVIAEWAGRVGAIGHGQREDWTAAQAIEHARAEEPLHDFAVAPNSGFHAGDIVSVSPEGPDSAAIVGTLIGLDDCTITVSREDKRAGKGHVHVPRAGQVLTAAA